MSTESDEKPKEEKEPQNVGEWRHFLKGIVIGVLGNLIVSACVGTVESSGANKMAYATILAMSILFLDYMVKKEGEELGISKTWIRKVRLCFWAYLAFWVIWFILTFFVFKWF